ncbi:MAG: epimerase [Prolixibacteraceae bacterium]|nr:epimerase [Prolixibacteraceae bacterium]
MKIIITGSTGMVGEGILLECLSLPQINHILSVSRKPCGIVHPKLSEYIVPDFLALDVNDEKLKGYDACFFCAGISSVGVSETDYHRMTYDTTMHFARCTGPNPNMSFIYVSGGGTDSSEMGRMAWARIKGKTENHLMQLPFKQAFGYRIGFMIPAKGQKRVLSYYQYFAWLIPLIKLFFPNFITSMNQVALSMLYVYEKGYHSNVIHVKDIKKLAKKI